MPTVAVTGATGFVGSAVVAALAAHDAVVFGVARRGPAASAAWAGGPDGAALRGFVAVDLGAGGAVEVLREALAGQQIDVLVHAAGLAHRRATAAELEAANVRAVVHAMEWAAAVNVARVVLVSSVAVYRPAAQPLTEAAALAPITPYGHSKLAGEAMARQLAAQHGIELVVLRLATMYGPGDPGNVGRLLRTIRRRRLVPLGNGRTRKSLVHVRDAARVVAEVACRAQPTAGTYNLSLGWHELREIVAAGAMAEGRRTRRRWLLVPGQARVVRALQAVVGWPRVDALVGRVVRPVRTWLSDDAADGSALAAVLGDRFPSPVPLVTGFRDASLGESADRLGRDA